MQPARRGAGRATACGYASQTCGGETVAIGTNAAAGNCRDHDNRSIARGAWTGVICDQATALGNNVQVSGNSGIAIADGDRVSANIRGDVGADIDAGTVW